MGYFIACKKCGEQIRNKAPKCRHCGYQYKRVKWGCVFPIIVVVVFVIIAISGGLR